MDKRLDLEMVSRGLTSSRHRAQQLIKQASVKVNSITVTKPSHICAAEDDITLVADIGYVGRGGLKLEKALEHFGICCLGLCCLDIGASTGGFTDCLLQHGAARVAAVDVGHGQIDSKLRADPRVSVFEGTDIRAVTAESLGFIPDLITCDVSFISVTLVIPKIAQLISLSPSCQAVVLIKPQFEVGKGLVGKKGVVKDKKLHEYALSKAAEAVKLYGLTVEEIINSPVTGGDGNTEFLMYTRRGAV